MEHSLQSEKKEESHLTPLPPPVSVPFLCSSTEQNSMKELSTLSVPASSHSLINPFPSGFQPYFSLKIVLVKVTSDLHVAKPGAHTSVFA